MIAVTAILNKLHGESINPAFVLWRLLLQDCKCYWRLLESLSRWTWKFDWTRFALIRMRAPKRTTFGVQHDWSSAKGFKHRLIIVYKISSACRMEFLLIHGSFLKSCFFSTEGSQCGWYKNEGSVPGLVLRKSTFHLERIVGCKKVIKTFINICSSPMTIWVKNKEFR